MCVLLYKVQSNLDTCVDTRKKASEHSYIRPSFDNYGRSLAGFESLRRFKVRFGYGHS